MKKYLTNFISKGQTPQNQPMPGTNQVMNSAGGYTWHVDQWDRLHRFLILGSENGSYYAIQHQLTVENAKNVLACIEADGQKTVEMIVAISTEGRAPKNDPAIFALALASSVGNDATRALALTMMPQVCRTATHLFTFAETIKGMRGWGRGLRRAVGAWYTGREARNLAYQVVKYRQRGGWCHADVLRLAHPTPPDEETDALFKWITHREEATWATEISSPDSEAQTFIWAFEQAQRAENAQTIVRLIAEYDLPREAIPTQFLKEAPVWEALLHKMPMTAMIRNLGNMSKCGLVKGNNDAVKTIVKRLTDANRLRKARVHPLAVLSALRVYRLGYGLRGQLNRYGYMQVQSQERQWTPAPRVLDALDTAFELAFQQIEPTHKRTLLALDVSGSMGFGMLAGVAGLTPRDGAAAMAMVTARTEPDYDVISFQEKIVPLPISARMRLDDVVDMTTNLPFGRTDCAQPMLYALENKLEIDTFIVYTDSETWFGKVHPAEALRDYRQKTGIPARLIVVGMIANNFTIANPDDAGMLDVVGFDTAAPRIMADFARGTL